MGKLNGKMAVVTGAAGGIGRATAVEFAREGARLVVVDLNEEGLTATVAEVAEVGGQADAVVADVSQVEGVEEYMSAAEAIAPVDVLFNNAAVFRAGGVAEMAIEDFDLLMQVNVRSVWLGLRRALPQMVERRSGSVINTASVNGLVTVPGTAAYTASKHAIVGMTKGAATDVGRSGVRVNAICPAWTDTPMLRAFGDVPELEGFASRVAPLGRLCAPEEQAKVVAFLASDEAAYVTGTAVATDGGTTATVYAE